MFNTIFLELIFFKYSLVFKRIWEANPIEIN